ncbi:hypothetical protein [Neptunicella sp. SCSIO 80796]|uniref:hypothetical protein n=1 Tax=Neptunicella plasticusilytica TaxID=3117012 RepID=UPI003A4D65BE
MIIAPGVNGSKFNKMWYDMGREARLNAERTAALTNAAVILPESSNNATAASYWRKGWNSPTLSEIKHYITQGHPVAKRLANQHLQHIRTQLGVNH